MAITFRASAVGGYNPTARTTTLAAVPAGVAAGDVVLVHFYTEDSAPTVTPPTGFTELTFTTAPATATNGVSRQRVFWKRTTGADTGNYAFTHASAITECTAAAYSGCVATGTPVEVLGSAVNEAVTATPPAVSGSTSVADEMLVYGLISYSFSTTVGPPTGFTTSHNPNGTTDGLYVAYMADPTPGATGSITASNSTGSSQFAVTLVGLIPEVTVVTVNATLSGSGTLTSTRTPRLTRAAALSGAGTLSATRTPRLARSAPLSGAGTASAAPTPRLTRAGALSGAGDLVAEAIAAYNAQLTGDGELTTELSFRLVTWVFRTPTRELPFRMAGRGLIATQPYGLTVYRKNGQWATTLAASAALLDGADRVYAGGRAHHITGAEADDLRAAGFTDLSFEEIQP